APGDGDLGRSGRQSTPRRSRRAEEARPAAAQSALRRLLLVRREAERPFDGAYLDRERLAKRALLKRLDDERRLVLARLVELEEGALAAGRRLEAILRVEVGQLEVDRLGSDALL